MFASIVAEGLAHLKSYCREALVFINMMAISDREQNVCKHASRAPR